jgi:hypothetical protein
VDFTAFSLSQLPEAPARVLEVGCGPEGGIVASLADAGYEVLGIDPRAPAGARFRAIRLEELDEEPFDAVVVERVLHHVHPLGPAVDKLARLAPLLVLDEFAWERIDEAARDWYEAQRRALVAAGHEPKGPPDLAAWREAWDDLHPSEAVRAELDRPYEQRLFEWRPYLYRWLGGPATEQLEQTLVESGAIPAIGFRYVGVTRPAERQRP